MSETTKTPFSVYPSIYQKFASESDVIPWTDVLEILDYFSHQPLKSKADADLFNFVRYIDGRRRHAHAIDAGGMILDIDGGMQVQDAVTILREGGWESVLYTSASHDPDAIHKFRIVVPLSDMIPARNTRRVWDSLNSVFGEACDQTKRGEHSIFYLPAAYEGVANEYYYFLGDLWSAEQWMDAYPTPDPDALVTEVRQRTMLDQMRARLLMRTRRGRSWMDDGVTLTPLSENPFVTERAVDDYLSNRGGWYHGRFAFLMSVAKVAHLKGYAISPGELVETFNALDALDGGYYQKSQDQRRLMSDAARAIQTVGW